MDANLGIVIVNYRNTSMTELCIKSLEGVEGTVIVVDNSPGDDAIQRHFPDVVYLPQSENSGFTGGYNRGMQEALDRGCDQILILNNDTVVDPEAIPKLQQAVVNGVVATPSILNPKNPKLLATIAGEFDWEKGKWGRMATRGRVEAAAGACLLFPRSALEKVGLFDEKFFLYYEDVDLCRRLRDAGIEIDLVPTASVMHLEGGSTGSGEASPLSLYYNHRNRLLLMKKHSSDQQWRRFVSRFTWTRIPILLRYAIAGDFNRYRAIRAGIRDFKKGRFGRADEWHR